MKLYLEIFSLIIIVCIGVAKYHGRHHKTGRRHLHFIERELKRAKRNVDQTKTQSPKAPNKQVPRPYLSSQVQEVRVQIKLKHLWRDRMKEKYSPERRLLDGNVVDAVSNELIHDRNFLEARVLGFRKSGSKTLADIAIKFFKTEDDPVEHLEGIVDSGWISGLPVNRSYFKLLQIINGNDDKSKWSFPKGLRLRVIPAMLTKVPKNQKEKKRKPLPLQYKEIKASFELRQKWYAFLSDPKSSVSQVLTGNVREALDMALTENPKYIECNVYGLRESPEGFVVADVGVRFTPEEVYPAQQIKVLIARGDISGMPVTRDFFIVTEINNVTKDEKSLQPSGTGQVKPQSEAENETTPTGNKLQTNLSQPNDQIGTQALTTQEYAPRLASANVPESTKPTYPPPRPFELPQKQQKPISQQGQENLKAQQQQQKTYPQQQSQQYPQLQPQQYQQPQQQLQQQNQQNLQTQSQTQPQNAKVQPPPAKEQKPVYGPLTENEAQRLNPPAKRPPIPSTQVLAFTNTKAQNIAAAVLPAIVIPNDALLQQESLGNETGTSNTSSMNNTSGSQPENNVLRVVAGVISEQVQHTSALMFGTLKNNETKKNESATKATKQNYQPEDNVIEETDEEIYPAAQPYREGELQGNAEGSTAHQEQSKALPQTGQSGDVSASTPYRPLGMTGMGTSAAASAGAGTPAAARVGTSSLAASNIGMAPPVAASAGSSPPAASNVGMAPPVAASAGSAPPAASSVGMASPVTASAGSAPPATASVATAPSAATSVGTAPPAAASTEITPSQPMHDQNSKSTEHQQVAQQSLSVAYMEHELEGSMTLQQRWHPLLAIQDSPQYEILEKNVVKSIKEIYHEYNVEVNCQLLGINKTTVNGSQTLFAAKKSEKVNVKFKIFFDTSTKPNKEPLEYAVNQGDVAGLLVYPHSLVFAASREEQSGFVYYNAQTAGYPTPQQPSPQTQHVLPQETSPASTQAADAVKQTEAQTKVPSTLEKNDAAHQMPPAELPPPKLVKQLEAITSTSQEESNAISQHTSPAEVPSYVSEKQSGLKESFLPPGSVTHSANNPGEISIEQAFKEVDTSAISEKPKEETTVSHPQNKLLQQQTDTAGLPSKAPVDIGTPEPVNQVQVPPQQNENQVGVAVPAAESATGNFNYPQNKPIQTLSLQPGKGAQPGSLESNKSMEAAPATQSTPARITGSQAGKEMKSPSSSPSDQNDPFPVSPANSVSAQQEIVLPVRPWPENPKEALLALAKQSQGDQQIKPENSVGAKPPESGEPVVATSAEPVTPKPAEPATTKPVAPVGSTGTKVVKPVTKPAESGGVSTTAPIEPAIGKPAEPAMSTTSQSVGSHPAASPGTTPVGSVSGHPLGPVESATSNFTEVDNGVPNNTGVTVEETPDFKLITLDKGMPKSCEEIKNWGIGNTEGEYVIEAREECHISIICQNMDGKHPIEFLGGPNQKEWSYYHYAVMIRISSNDKKNIPAGACLENSGIYESYLMLTFEYEHYISPNGEVKDENDHDDGRKLLEKIKKAGGKQNPPLESWKTNIKKMLAGRRKRDAAGRSDVSIITSAINIRKEHDGERRHPRSPVMPDAEWGVL